MAVAGGNKTKVAVIGASGYVGEELARLLLRHPRAELVAVTSRQFTGKSGLRLAGNLSEENFRCETGGLSGLLSHEHLTASFAPDSRKSCESCENPCDKSKWRERRRSQNRGGLPFCGMQ